MANTKDVKLRLLIETVDHASRGIAAVSKQVNRLSNNLQKAEQISSQLVATGARLTAIGAGLSAAFFFPIKSAADFEKAMSGVLAVTEGAAKNFDLLTQKASELGGTTEFTATQVAEGMRFLGQAGFDAMEVLQAMDATVDLATAGQLELADAADIASNVLQGMRLPIENINSVMNTLANTAASSNTNIQQLGEALKFAAPAAAAAGISIEKTAALIGALGNAGIQASLAGTAIRGMLASLSDTSPKAQAALDALNVTIVKTADGGIDLVQTLADLGKANLNLEQAFAIFQRRGAAAALSLAAQTKGVQELIKSNEENTGALTKMANTMRDNLIGAFKELTSAIDRFSRSLGSPLLTPLTVLLRFLANLFNSLGKLGEKFPALSGIILGTIGVVALLTTVLGIALLAAGLLGGAVVNLSRLYGLLSASATASILPIGASGLAMQNAALNSSKLGLAMAALRTKALIPLIGILKKLRLGWIATLGPWALAAAAIWGVYEAGKFLFGIFGKVTKEIDEQTKKSKELTEQREKDSVAIKKMDGDQKKLNEEMARATKQNEAQAKSLKEVNNEIKVLNDSMRLRIDIMSDRTSRGIEELEIIKKLAKTEKERAAVSEQILNLEKGSIQQRLNLLRDEQSQIESIFSTQLSSERKRISESKSNAEERGRALISIETKIGTARTAALQKSFATEKSLLESSASAISSRLQTAIQAYQGFTDKIKSLEQEVLNNKRSTTDAIRQLDFKLLTDEEKFNTQLALAKELVEKQKRASARATTAASVDEQQKAIEESKKFAEQAKSALQGIPLEFEKNVSPAVKKEFESWGFSTLVGLEQSIPQITSILKEVGAVTEQTLNREIELNKQSADIVKQKGEDLKNSFETVNQQIEDVENKLASISQIDVGFNVNTAQLLDEFNAVKNQIENTPITIQARIITTQAQKLGGLIKKFQEGGLAKMMAVGGKLSGYGGGDKIRALLEQGEFVVRKEAVKRYGTAFMNAINGMKFPQNSYQGFQAGGSVGKESSNTVNLNLSLGGKTVNLQGESGEVKKLINILRREGLTTA